MADKEQPAVSRRGQAARAKAPKPEKQNLAKMSREERAEVMEQREREQSQSMTMDRANTMAVTRRLRSVRMRRPAHKILFFIDGHAPTIEEFGAAAAIGNGVVFRNGRKIVEGAPLENCDYVFAMNEASIPIDYAARFPIVSGRDPQIEDDEMPDIVGRPSPSKHTSGLPDDARPGTVDTGEAHGGAGTASGDNTKGLITKAPSDEEIRIQAMADAWRAGRTGT